MEQNPTTWVALAWLAIREIIPLWKKHVSGTYRSYAHIDEKTIENRRMIDSLSSRIDGINHASNRLTEELRKMDKLLTDHLEFEADENVRIGKMESEQSFHRETLARFEKNQDSIFKMLGDIKNMMIQQAK